MSASALPWSEQELTVAAHPYQLPASTGTHLHLDAKVTGLGGASCGQGGPLRDDRTMSTARDFGFVIRPLTLGRAALSHINATARVSLSGEMPINISRNRAGIVTLSSGAKDRTIVYTAGNDKKATTYRGEAIQLRQYGDGMV
jgi:beta-galactosidase